VDGNNALSEAFFKILIIFFKLYTNNKNFFKNVAAKNVKFLGL